MLEATDLVKTFGGVRAVDGVSLRVMAGEVVALIGPNGAGTTTRFNLLTGQLMPDRGRLAIAGVDTTGWSPRRLARHRVGRGFQIAQAFASMTVRENLQTALVARDRGLWRLWRRLASTAVAEADSLLAAVELADQADRPAGDLAYGDLKRLELALALSNRPRLLLLDEPTAGTAPAERRTLMTVAVTLARRDHVAVLFTEHDMDVVFAFADRVLVLDAGKLIAEGSPASVRANPAVRRAYLGSEA
ncbi:MAG: ABC transporter ATP-binding protein [Alphaproteobacteria bacterium]|nr:ABC transporter ATP-binding protein [Alphaproteobacteria bacterium]